MTPEESALRACGRFNVKTATGPRSSRKTQAASAWAAGSSARDRSRDFIDKKEFAGALGEIFNVFARGDRFGRNNASFKDSLSLKQSSAMKYQGLLPFSPPKTFEHRYSVKPGIFSANGL